MVSLMKARKNNQSQTLKKAIHSGSLFLCISPVKMKRCSEFLAPIEHVHLVAAKAGAKLIRSGLDRSKMIDN